MGQPHLRRIDKEAVIDKLTGEIEELEVENKRLKANTKRLAENNDLLHEYIETHRVSQLQVDNERLQKLLVELSKKCTCTRSWPRAGRHEESCQTYKCEQALKETK